MSLIHQKLLRLSSNVENRGSGNQAMNLLNNDCQRLENAYRYLHFVWASPMLVILCFIFVSLLLGILPVLGGVAVYAVLLPLSILIGKRLQTLRKKVICITDERVEVSTEMLATVETIKLYSLETFFLDKIIGVREKEMQLQKAYSLLKSIHNFINSVIVPSTIAISFLIYTSLQLQLDASKAFITISFLNVLKIPFTQLNNVITSIIEGFISLKRIQHFLQSQEKLPPTNNPTSSHLSSSHLSSSHLSSSHLSSSHPSPSHLSPSVYIRLQNSSFSWNPSSVSDLESQVVSAENEKNVSFQRNAKKILLSSSIEERRGERIEKVRLEEGEVVGINQPSQKTRKKQTAEMIEMTTNRATLRDINFYAKGNELICVVGRVGSGKVSFFKLFSNVDILNFNKNERVLFLRVYLERFLPFPLESALSTWKVQ